MPMLSSLRFASSAGAGREGDDPEPEGTVAAEAGTLIKPSLLVCGWGGFADGAREDVASEDGSP